MISKEQYIALRNSIVQQIVFVGLTRNIPIKANMLYQIFDNYFEIKLLFKNDILIKIW